jgi:type IV secretion system protein TrbG
MKPTIAIALCASAALIGCAGKAKRPAFTFDPPAFQAAALVPEPSMAAEVAAPPVLVAAPPQPLPVPRSRKAGERKAPTARVAAANRAGTREPSSHGYVNAVQVYPWIEGTVYRLYTAPEQVSDIALQPGETLTAVAAGDTVRWVVGDTTSGTGATRRVHVLIKPTGPGLKTNLVITTDRRSYHLQVESTARTAMAAVSWTYPQDQLLALDRGSGDGAEGSIASGVAVQDLRFRYEISGDRPPWRPTRAFDDGRQVFIEFPARLDQGEAPPLFVVGPEGDNQLVNYRVRGSFYIVDRLFAAAELRLGGKRQQVVRISRTDRVSDGRSSKRRRRKS